MPGEFENEVADFIKVNRLFDLPSKVLLAVSGGADSTGLLYVMQELKARRILSADFVCAHINHQLRGKYADMDEDFVIEQADKLKLPITTRRVDVRRFARKNKLSIETAARKLRIEALLDIAKANNCRLIATAHQKNDNAETILQRLGRGTGFRGLGGIWPMRSFDNEISFVRPLLCVSRNQIVEYLKSRNLKWRIDKTNQDCRYRRNFIRHRLLPALQQQHSGSIVEQLFDLSQSAQRFYRLVCSCAEKAWLEVVDCGDGEFRLDVKKFLAQPGAVKVELIRRSLTHLGSGERDLTQGHFERILQLAEQNVSGRKIQLPGRFVVCREYDRLVFAKAKGSSLPSEQGSESTKIQVPGRTRFAGYSIEATVFEAKENDIERFKRDFRLRTSDITGKNNLVERFDLDRVKLPLVVRFRRAGDRFWPLGLGAEKKVGKFLSAAHLPEQLRRQVLIIADSEKIIWVRPIRITEQAKITTTTRKILQLQTDYSR